MSKALLYAVNPSTTPITSGGTINFGSVVRRYGSNINISGGSPYISGCGYYSINTNITVDATETGTAFITLYKDGVAIPGATQSITVGAVGDNIAFSIPAVIRQTCCIQSTISAVLTGVSGNILNASIEIEKA